MAAYPQCRRGPCRDPPPCLFFFLGCIFLVPQDGPAIDTQEDSEILKDDAASMLEQLHRAEQPAPATATSGHAR